MVRLSRPPESGRSQSSRYPLSPSKRRQVWHRPALRDGSCPGVASGCGSSASASYRVVHPPAIQREHGCCSVLVCSRTSQALSGPRVPLEASHEAAGGVEVEVAEQADQRPLGRRGEEGVAALYAPHRPGRQVVAHQLQACRIPTADGVGAVRPPRPGRFPTTLRRRPAHRGRPHPAWRRRSGMGLTTATISPGSSKRQRGMRSDVIGRNSSAAQGAAGRRLRRVGTVSGRQQAMIRPDIERSPSSIDVLERLRVACRSSVSVQQCDHATGQGAAGRASRERREASAPDPD